jgi:3,4-dihydroxy 2-butanone 4-phosphate synthase/GTP cyclohydrolase II
MTGAVLAGPRADVQAMPDALTALRRGEPVLVTDRTGDQHMVIAAERVTGPTMALLVRHSSGFACVAVEGDRLAALDVPLMAADGEGREAFAVSVDAVGLTTGISAQERARTARTLADPASTPADLVRPGHVMPVRVRPGGVLQRAAVPEAAADLCRLAGLAPAAVFAALTEPPTDPALRGLVTVRVEDVVRHRERVESPVRRTGSAPLTNRHGLFQEHTYLDVRDGTEHLAVVAGDVADAHAVLVRVHTECPAGDLLGSVQCGCAGDLEAALSAVAAADRGVVVYLRRSGPPTRERGHGPSGRGTLADTRGHRVTAHVLLDLGIRSAVLLTDDPRHALDLAAHGMPVIGSTPLQGTPAGPVTVP